MHKMSPGRHRGVDPSAAAVGFRAGGGRPTHAAAAAAAAGGGLPPQCSSRAPFEGKTGSNFVAVTTNKTATKLIVESK